MFFLDTSADKAAEYLCDQDCATHLEMAVKALQQCQVTTYTSSIVYKWLQEDGFNYHWLGYFCERLQHRVDSHKYFSEITNLRHCVPVRLRCKQQTDFPYDKSNPHYFPTASVVGSYRIDYVKSRFNNAIWEKVGCPGWFFRLANTILPQRERQDFLLRVQPAGPSGANNQRSLLVERKDVRDGPVGTIDSGSLDKFSLWE